MTVPRVLAPLSKAGGVTWRSRFKPSIVVVAVILLIRTVLPASDLYITNQIIFAAIGAVALNMLTGIAGQVSIGNAAFMGIGAYTVVLLGGHGGLLLAIPAAALVSGAVGVLIGLPALRIRGIYLVLGTLALQYIAAFAFQEYQQAENAIGGFTLPIAMLGPWHFSSDAQWFWVAIVALFATMLVAHLLLATKPGRAWVAIREHDVAAAVVGVNRSYYLILAFMVSSAIIGVEGALLAEYAGEVTLDSYTLTVAVAVAAMILIGGLGSIEGAVLGACIVTGLPFVVSQAGATWFSSSGFGSFVQANLSSLELALYALIVLVLLFIEPNGLAALLRRGSHASASSVVRIWNAAARREVPALDTGASASSLGYTASLLKPVVGGSGTARRLSHPDKAAAPQPLDPLLELRDVTVSYTGAIGVRDATINVLPHEVVALVGPNGAGKTSTVRAAAGFLPEEPGRVVAGEVLLDGRRIDRSPPYRIARAGLIFVPEREKAFSSLTVRQQIALAVAATKRSDPRGAVTEAIARFPALADQLDRKASMLSGGQRQMLALAAAVVRNPRLLIVDELSQGLAPGAVKMLEVSMRSLAEEGLSILIVEQDLGLAERLADRIYVLEAGQVVDEYRASGPAGTAGDLTGGEQTRLSDTHEAVHDGRRKKNANTSSES